MKRSSILAAIALAALAHAPARAQSVADFYRGKQLRFIVFTSAGGEYDAWARLMARHLGKHVPGEPTAMVQNMPGGGGIVAGNYMAFSAPRDGTVFALLSRNIPFQALMKDDNIKFDPRKFDWIGSPELSNRVCVAKEGSPVQKAEDLFEREMSVGGTGSGSAASTVPVLLSRLLGMKFRLVEGYPGANDVQLAMERGEVHGICQTYATFPRTHPGQIEAGKLKVLFNLERGKIPGLDTRSIYAFTKTEEQRQILTLINSSIEFGRPFFTTPDTPPERLAALRAGFEKMLDDPDFRAEAERQNLVIALTRGEDIQRMVADMLATPDEIVRKTAAMTK
jgi:tripartite-type tricarboxylate transporter receptor subunit TctC